MRLFRQYITLIIMLLGCGVSYSQENRTEVCVDFRVNLMQIEQGYRDNKTRLHELVTLLQQLREDTTLNIVRVEFCGAASPEGSYEWNRHLAGGRLKALEKLVRSKVQIPDSIISYDDGYIPWSHLVSQISESDISHKQEILSIIEGPAEIVDYHSGRKIDSRILELQKLDGGRLWKQMLRRYFAPMRNACVAITTTRKEPIVTAPAIWPAQIPELALDELDVPLPVPPLADITLPIVADTLPMSVQPAKPWQPKLYVKTNALGLGLAIANAGVEVDMGRHWSFNLPVYYSAWDYFSPTVKFRTFALQPEVRYWFSERYLCNDGWFAGAHIGFAYYNLATNSDFRRQDHKGTTPTLGGGLAVGYRMPISANKRWKMEFSVGAGVYPLKFDLFHNYPNGLLWSTKSMTYVGFDQATLSFSYTFNLKERGKRKEKGGGRER